MKWLKRILWIVSSLLLLLIAGMYLFSPYKVHDGMSYASVKESVIIDKPVEEVYAYMGNSENARDWSVFVDHITPLNDHTHPDGAIGAQRRCYTKADETGARWDETILIAEENKRRQLDIYNMQEFPMTAEGLLTEQLYRKIDDTHTELSLTLFYKEGMDTWWSRWKMYFASYKVARIFHDNLVNIKKFNEAN